ncbi:MurT ligase domain-containing protein [Ellagibacter isourolithinifaciens]|uniref:MurT ligase domain-containing protein n=1 Tax=Ellagibacter isourolithinifaciens TaxID=2137581 RepID=UPI003AF13CA5
MSIRFAAAQAVSSISTWGLKHVFRRPAANFPGKIALYVDPRLLANLRGKLTRGSIMVVGTNGKTTVTNLLADVLEGSGVRVVCNRTGANLDSGVSTALLHAKEADWGVFESDELWLKKMTPQLKPTYVLLLNLFRDQLDRCGEIDRIQDSIVEALAASPETILVFNADDPLCATIAKRASELPGRERTRQIAFGVSESMGLAQNTVSDATMCQLCSSMFEYDFRQYGQLGAWHCPTCGFSRPALDFAAQNVELGERELSFDIARPQPNAGESAPARPIRAAFSGAYMVYNLLAVGVAADLVGCGNDAIQAAIESFDPKNGRLQRYSVEGRSILLNLAKNPTGFNQNLKIIEKDASPKAVAFFINDKEADGRDISWLWDIDFEELSRQEGCVVFAGGIRGNDMQVRLKYAGIPSKVVKNTQEFLDELAKLPHEMNAYAIANYTALPSVKSALDAAEGEAGDPTNCEVGDPVRADGGLSSSANDSSSIIAAAPDPARGAPRAVPQRSEDCLSTESPAQDRERAGSNERLSVVEPTETGESSARAQERTTPIVIAHMFPDLLNLYGDGGNVRILSERLAWRGIPVQVKRVEYGESVDLGDVDLVFLGGGPDREQKLASAELMRMKDELAAYVEEDGPVLAICGGYQILGKTWLLGDEEVPGLDIVGIETRRPGTSADRLIDNIVLSSPLATHPVVGYENHAGRTYLVEGVKPFGAVVSSVGHGNNDADKADGALYRKVLGTYLHGPLLSKNPEIADWLLAAACERHARRTGESAPALARLDDAEELAANAFMADKAGAK